MRTIIHSLTLLALLAAALPAAAGEKFDPDARAKLIAPFVTEQTFAVVHVDFTRLPIEPILAFAKQMAPGADNDVGRESKEILSVLASFRRAGGKDIYLVASFPGYIPQSESDLLLGVIPLDGVDAKAVTNLLQPLFFDVQRRGEVLVFGKPPALELGKKAKPQVRPELPAAFTAAGDTAAQVLFVPAAYWRRVIEEMMPTLHEAMGGGPSTVFTHGIRWAALGIDPPPALAARLVVQSQDAGSAAALEKQIHTLWEAAKRFTAKTHDPMPPWADEAARRLAPEVRGDRLIVELNEKLRTFLDATLLPALRGAQPRK